MAKKVNGLLIDFKKKGKVFLVRNRRGETLESTATFDSALDFAKKDRTYVKYSPKIGGMSSSGGKREKEKKDKEK